MKTQVKYGVLPMVIVLLGWMTTKAQVNDWEVPGDNFSLEGALELFKQSSSPEEFEKLLNSADSKVNNLDLNGDGYVDYIKVIDRNEGNIHAFILQAVISEREYQDIAVIELEKLANGKAVLQITGDADVYGMETIIEPTEEVRINAGTTVQRRVVNVWTWPSVRYVYGPYYTVWVSPWRWTLRPVWWSAWGPVAYYEYYPWWRPYRPYYSVCYTHRVTYAPHLYRPYRTTSVVVAKRNNERIATYRSKYNREDHYNRGRNDDRRNDHRDVADRDNSRHDSRYERSDNRKPTVSRDDFSNPRRRISESESPRSYSNRNTELKQRSEPVRRSVSPTPYGGTRTQEIQRDMNRTKTERTTTYRRPSNNERGGGRELQNTSPVAQRSISSPRNSSPTRVSRQPSPRPSVPSVKPAPTRNSGTSGGSLKRKSKNN